MNTRIDLIRHAESELNLHRGVIGGRSNATPLSTAGRTAAVALGRRLAADGWHPDVVYHTSAVRSRDTARLLAGAAGWPEPEVHDGLLELSQGAAEGGPRDQWWSAAEIARMRRDPLHHRLAPDGENHAEVQARMRAALVEIAGRHPGGHVVAVGHGIAIRTLVWSVRGDDHQEGFVRQELANLGLVRVVVSPAGEITLA